MKKQNKTIRVGVLGAGRGMSFALAARDCGMKMTAVCDVKVDSPDRKDQCALFKEVGIACYADFDRFLEHDMDAVVVANFFHQHAPFAIKALAAGMHVLSETQACHTLAEGVALARAVEKSGCIYMFAENYAYTAAVQEMQRLFRSGFAGLFQYGEGEYVHPAHRGILDTLQLVPFLGHWRTWKPATYYCSHAMAPVMFITGTRPVKVNGFVVPRDLAESQHFSVMQSDRAGMIVCRMDNGAVVKLLQGGLQGGRTRVRIHGSRALMETTIDGQLHLKQEPWATPDGKGHSEIFKPVFREHAEVAQKSTHGGSDFFITNYFAEAIRRNEQPFLDVYRGIDMSIIGILAYRSALNNSASEDVPDFRDEAARKKYENDNWSPDPERRAPGQPAPSICGNVQITDDARRFAELTWNEHRKRRAMQDWKEYNTKFEVIAEHSGADKRKLVEANLADWRQALIGSDEKTEDKTPNSPV